MGAQKSEAAMLGVLRDYPANYRPREARRLRVREALSDMRHVPHNSEPVVCCIAMPDVFTKRKRSEVMSRIRGRGNKDTEVALAKLLRTHRISGWRRNQRVFGKPDFVFVRQHIAVFVDGCFWHACPKHSNMPTNNRAFWKRKLTANKVRDRLVTRQLRRDGWRVVRIWEHELVTSPANCVKRILRKLSDKP